MLFLLLLQFESVDLNSLIFENSNVKKHKADFLKNSLNFLYAKF